ncbi:hypothetical protein [Pseudorhodoferax sp.]|uniref:hypothetical protein n=1 Tax=Pseudorhodoferax sp. TaxID=1993553 RepID=UPI002DD66DCA|nr:hypothetical protein [Pseudorhodoferax sp.]
MPLVDVHQLLDDALQRLRVCRVDLAAAQHRPVRDDLPRQRAGQALQRHGLALARPLHGQQAHGGAEQQQQQGQGQGQAARRGVRFHGLATKR